MKPPLPRSDSPRESRAWVALWASIWGAIAFSGFAAGLVLVLWLGTWSMGSEALRLGYLGKGLLIALGGGLVVLFSLGFAINRRMFKLGKDGLESSGGDDDDQPTTTKATATVEVQQ